MTLERLWAGWRSAYMQSAGAPAPAGEGCTFCRILAQDDDREALVVWRGERVAAVLNAYPYTSGHLLVMPLRHVADLEELDPGESADLWDAVAQSVVAIKAAYRPEGLNIGANLGRASGAGIPGHLHLHVLPRWSGDSNFMTSVAEARILPEPLSDTYDKITRAWPR
jgi:ATP adenylyltransferase